MASTTRILELASIIQSNTAKFDELLTKQGEPTPSFKVNNTRSKTCALRYEATDEITNSRDHVLEAMDELRALMLGPLGFLHQEVIQTHSNLISLQAIAQFQVATKLPIEEEQTYEEWILFSY